MKISKKRGSILISVILAMLIMFASCFTVFADGTETPIVPIDSGVEINGLNLILSGEIGLTFHVYVPKKYRDGTMKLTFMDNEPITMNITDCPRDSNLRYTATYYLSAIELSEPVTLTVYDKYGQPLAQKSRSAEDYVNLLLKDEKATEQEKNVAKSLINYGHFAQLACSEENGWVIGEDLAETSKLYDLTVGTDVFDAYGIEWEKYSTSFRTFNMALRLDYKTDIYLYFPLSEKPTVTVNGKAAEAVKSERSRDRYEVRIGEISALKLDEKYTVTVNEAVFKISAFTYCNLAVSSGKNKNTIDAIRALYEFYRATVDYQVAAGVQN